MKVTITTVQVPRIGGWKEEYNVWFYRRYYLTASGAERIIRRGDDTQEACPNANVVGIEHYEMSYNGGKWTLKIKLNKSHWKLSCKSITPMSLWSTLEFTKMSAKIKRILMCERKVQFSLMMAEKTAKRIYQEYHVLQRPYLCPYCRNWHLTKNPLPVR